MGRSKRLVLGCLSLVVLCGAVIMFTPTAKQAEATGLFGKLKKDKCDEPPTWGEMIHGKKRWVTKWDGGGFCDRQTGLVWEAAPEFLEPPGERTWSDATFYCINRIVEGDKGQKGWRLPSVAELASLVDTRSTLCAAGGPCLPDGNPFGDLVRSAPYWSASTDADLSSNAWRVTMGRGLVLNDFSKDETAQAWCVRGATDTVVY